MGTENEPAVLVSTTRTCLACVAPAPHYRRSHSPRCEWSGLETRGWFGYSFHTVAVWLACVVCCVGASEAMSGVAEAALGEGKDFR